jgi:hypothetical protein
MYSVRRGAPAVLYSRRYMSSLPRGASESRSREVWPVNTTDPPTTATDVAETFSLAAVCRIHCVVRLASSLARKASYFVEEA